MEVRCGQIDPPQCKKNMISLEEYLDFVDSGKEMDLTVCTLNQIISMHGFSKQKTQKNKLIDALNSMKLMNLSRSTIHNNDVSSLAYIPMEEAMADLLNLDWQECSVTSIQTLNSVNHDFSLQNSPASASKSGPRKRKSRQKKMKRKVLGSKRVEADKAIVTVATDVANSDDKLPRLIGETQSTDRKPFDSPSFKLYYKRKKKKSVHALTTGSISARETRKVKMEEHDDAEVVKHGLVFSMLPGVQSTPTLEAVRHGLVFNMLSTAE